MATLKPDLKCDVVMKGGITSGIVYPSAMCELAEEFRFVNIGGTSAGAIAASLTAAAEYRRLAHDSTAGFEELATIPEWLAEPAAEGSRLGQLFQASNETEDLFDLAMPWIDAGTFQSRVARTAKVLLTRFTRHTPVVASIAFLLILTLILASVLLWPVPHGSIVSVLLGLTAIVIVALAIAMCLAVAVLDALQTMMTVLPDHGFGLCRGLSTPLRPTALTQWLADEIDKVAGVTDPATPLTFGNLWNAVPSLDGGKALNLEMMTTCLTLGRPYRLPFDTHIFFFSAREFRQLFPERIVQAMIAVSPTTSDQSEEPTRTRTGEALYAFPPASQLPIVVAARMSLSFPILLSAVPLWAVDHGKRNADGIAEQLWFSDGGITSNFPVHFFDAAQPRWPTFAFDLGRHTDRYNSPGKRVYAPKQNNAGLLDGWTILDTIPRFLGAIIGTMMNWRDTMLTRVPGYRDRIVHILLSEKEGGLHLTMDPTTISDVAARGGEAATILRGRFGAQISQGEVLTWANHRWIRFLTFFAALERQLKDLSDRLSDGTHPPSVADLWKATDKLPSYKLSPMELDRVVMAATSFAQHAAGDFADSPFTTPKEIPPQPAPDLVLRPPV